MKVLHFIKSIAPTVAGLLLLTNSSAQWVKLPHFLALNSSSRIQFIDNNNGWMSYSSCDNCNVFQTSNGGKNWKEVAPFGNAFGPQCSFLYFKNKEEGIVSWGRKENYTYASRKTIDGGISWQNIKMENFTDKDQPKILSLQFVQDVYIGIAYQDNVINMIKIKNDTMQTSYSINEYPNSAFFCDSLTGYSAMNTGLRKTVNGGKSWVALRTGVNFALTKMHFTDALHGVAIGGSNIIHTINGGLSWKDVSITSNKLGFADVVFTTPKVGYVCGSQGILYKTKDGGLSWEEMDSGTFENLSSLSFPDSTIGYCVGDAGTLLKLVEDYTLPKVNSIKLTSNILCTGAEYIVSYTVNKKFKPNNIFTVYMSNALGEYATKGEIGSSISDTNGTIKITIPANIPQNIGYRIRIQSSSPESISLNNDAYLEIQPSPLVGLNVTLDKSQICEGDKVTLSTFVVAGGSNPLVSWYNNKTLIGKGLKFTFAPKDKDLIYTSVKSSLACAKPDSVLFAYLVQCTKEPLPQAVIPEALYIQIKSPSTPTITAQGNILTSSNSGNNQWFKNGSLIPMATNANYAATETGLYKVQVNDKVCPAAFSNEVSIIINGLELENESNKITIYPNPTHGILNIISQTQMSKLTIYDSKGQKALESAATEQLDVSALPEGLYLLELWDTEGRRVLRKFEKR